jgi:hypothetical protein
MVNVLKKRMWKIRKSASTKAKASQYDAKSDGSTSKTDNGTKASGGWISVGPRGEQIEEIEAIVKADLELEWDANDAVTRPRYGEYGQATDELYFDANCNDDYNQDSEESDQNKTIVSTDYYNSNMSFAPGNKDHVPLAQAENVSTDSETESIEDTNNTSAGNNKNSA